jgi:HSP90 family molecular chaperone
MKRVLIVLPFLLGILIAQENETDDPRVIIEKIRIYRLTRELDLTTEQAIKFFPKLNELQKIDKDFRARQEEILDNLKAMIHEDAEQKEIMKSLSRYETIFKEKVERQLSKMREIQELLTPVQQARYLIFQDEFEREIRRMIKEVRKLKPR